MDEIVVSAQGIWHREVGSLWTYRGGILGERKWACKADVRCPAPRYAQGLCETHWRHEQQPEGRRYEKRAAACSVEACGGKVLAKGMCSKHYRRAARGQSLVRDDERTVDEG